MNIHTKSDNVKEQIRKATKDDIDRIVGIYNEIHEAEERGKMHIGWQRDVYPTRETAEKALQRGDLFACIMDGKVCASAIINQEQLDSYAEVEWGIKADNAEVMVLHTLTVSPSCGKRGIGHKFVLFYEEYACQSHCRVLRMDTQAQNVVARKMYAKMGFKEVGIIHCPFQGIQSIQLVLLEKAVQEV